MYFDSRLQSLAVFCWMKKLFSTVKTYQNKMRNLKKSGSTYIHQLLLPLSPTYTPTTTIQPLSDLQEQPSSTFDLYAYTEIPLCSVTAKTTTKSLVKPM